MLVHIRGAGGMVEERSWVKVLYDGNGRELLLVREFVFA